jgi:hypothetical protein
MALAAEGVPVPRGDLRKAIRRAWPVLQGALNGSNLEDPAALDGDELRCAVAFGALARLWGVQPDEVEELWASGLLDSVLEDEFDPRSRLGLLGPV